MPSSCEFPSSFYVLKNPFWRVTRWHWGCMNPAKQIPVPSFASCRCPYGLYGERRCFCVVDLASSYDVMRDQFPLSILHLGKFQMGINTPTQHAACAMDLRCREFLAFLSIANHSLSILKSKVGLIRLRQKCGNFC